MRKIKSWGMQAAALVAAATLWELLVRTGVLDERFFPTFGQIGLGFVNSIQDLTLPVAVGTTLRRLAISFGIAAAGGLLLGVAMGMSRFLASLFRPFVDILYPLPKIALLPMIILLTERGDISLIVVTCLTAGLQIAISVNAAVHDIDRSLMEVGTNFGANGRRKVTHIVFPALLPATFSAFRTGLGLCLVSLVIVEFLSSQTGIGAFVEKSWQTLTVENIYVGLIVTAVLGHLLNGGLRTIEKLVIPWNISWAAEQVVTATKR